MFVFVTVSAMFELTSFAARGSRGTKTYTPSKLEYKQGAGKESGGKRRRWPQTLPKWGFYAVYADRPESAFRRRAPEVTCVRHLFGWGGRGAFRGAILSASRGARPIRWAR